MSNNSVIFWVLSGLVLLGAIYIFIPDSGEEPVTTAAPLPVTDAVTELPLREPAAVAAPTASRISVPAPVQPTPAVTAPEPEPAPEAQPLPGLNESDLFVRQQLRDINGGVSVLQLLASEEVIRKFVVFIQNIREGDLPIRDLPMLRPSLGMQVRELDDERFLMEEVSYQRFNAMVNTFMAVNTEQAVRLYLQLEPLFQEAYAEIGFRDQNFTDSLLEVIDSVLNARTARGPHELTRPSVAYHFANPAIEEDYSSVEKLLLRIGPENADKLKQSLRAFRNQLQMTL